MRYVLDTNVVSGLMAGDARLVAELAGRSREDVAVPEPVFAEIVYGIARLPRSRRRETLRARLELVRAELPAAAWTREVSDAFGRIKASHERTGTRIDDFDAAIAAHALAYESVLVTANVKHMARIADLVVEDWSA